jgi:His-Xaa-Ser system protein HxsD
MTQLATTLLGDGAVAVEIEEAVYPRDAVYAAAFAFIDRCWVHLDRADGSRIKATLRPKPGAPAATPAALAEELENELLGQAFRQRIADENRALVDRVMTAALGPGLAPGEPGEAAPPLDDLLAGDAFEDPLGIALSWEEKYAKKPAGPGPTQGDAPPAVAGGGHGEKNAQALDPAAAPIDDASSGAKEPGA